jgi:hypothetical protein
MPDWWGGLVLAEVVWLYRAAGAVTDGAWLIRIDRSRLVRRCQRLLLLSVGLATDHMCPASGQATVGRDHGDRGGILFFTSEK